MYKIKSDTLNRIFFGVVIGVVAVAALASIVGTKLLLALILVVATWELYKVRKSILVIPVAALIVAGTISVLYLRLTNPLLLIAVAVSVVVSDTSAYFTGRSCQGNKLWEKISPKKTRSGVLGSLAFAPFAFLAILLAGEVNITWVDLFVAWVIPFVATGGDLLESSLKRSVKIKDVNHLFGEHGSLLDRIDSMSAAFCFVGLVQICRILLGV